MRKRSAQRAGKKLFYQKAPPGRPARFRTNPQARAAAGLRPGQSSVQRFSAHAHRTQRLVARMARCVVRNARHPVLATNTFVRFIARMTPSIAQRIGHAILAINPFWDRFGVLVECFSSALGVVLELWDALEVVSESLRGSLGVL